MHLVPKRALIPMLLAVALVIGMFPRQPAFASASRTPVPPSNAPANAVLIEGESGVYSNNAGIATDHAYSGTGFGVISGENGSKITYTLAAESAGSYNVAFNYIAGKVSGWNDERSINLYINGTKTTLTFPGTETWDNWQYMSTMVQLNEGSNTVAIETNGSGNGICLDYFYYWKEPVSGTMVSIQFASNTMNLLAGASQSSVVQAVYDTGDLFLLEEGVSFSSDNENVAKIDSATGIITGVEPGTATITAVYNSFQATASVAVSNTAPDPLYPHPNAQVYQAEEAQLTGSAVIAKDHTGYTGSGFVGGYDNSNNAKTTFNVEVPSAGVYYLALRYSAGAVGGWPDNRTVGLSLNGGSTEPITLTGTDSTWNSWSEHFLKVQLNAGINTIAYMCLTSTDNSDTINLDKLSVWAYSANPVIDAIAFNPGEYTVSENSKVQSVIYEVNSNGIQSDISAEVTYTSSDSSIAKVDENGVITGVSAGMTTISATSGNFTAAAAVTVITNPTVTVNFSEVTRPVDPSIFGILLTPNYDIPDSRLTLLGPLLNRETIPVQNFQAIGDMDSAYYAYEESVLQRSLEAYTRVKSVGYKWYFLLGLNPSWATASGGPMDTLENKPLKTALQQARFKQYAKDVLQYYKDHGATPDFIDLTNEYWTGTEETFKGNWEALREVYPDEIPAVGPGAVGFDGIADFYIPYSSANNITLEGPSWHAFWTSNTYAPLSQLQEWKDVIADYQAQYPEVNGKYIIWEENNAGSTAPDDWTRSLANVIRTGVTQNIKGVMQAENWNGMSDLLQTIKSEQNPNPARRTSMWWVYYMFSQMSGQFVDVSTDFTEDFTAAASKDENESKIIFVKNNTAGSVNLDLRNQPYNGQDIQIDLYKITSSENNGLEYQYTITPASENDLELRVDNVGANESWMAIIKKTDAPPSFFFPKTPDDGEVAALIPTLTWSEAQGADSYTVTVSVNQDLSSPEISRSGITGTSFTVETPLTVGQKYYWRVTAENGSGSTSVSYNTVYSFIAGENTEVPGQFGPYMPSMYAPNESVTPELKWSTAYNATSYRIVVSTHEDLSSPVINQGGITNVRDTGQFGAQSQAYYQPSTALEYDTTYYWMVYAVNASGERPMNGPVHVFTTKAEGNSPTAFSLTAPANGAAEVSARAVLDWQPSKNAFFYKLEVSANADMSNPVIVRDRMIYNRYTVEPNLLLPDTTYYWRVTAYTKDLVYETASTDGIRSFTTEAVPVSPLLYAEKGTGDTVKLWFQSSTGATTYNIKYGTSEGNYTETIAGVTESPYEVTGLPNGTYYFAVAAVNASGESAIWNERSVTLDESEVQAPATAVTGVSLNKNIISLSLGGTEQLTATVTPGDAANKNVSWSSDNNAIATVDSTGEVTAVAAGTATVTVTTVDGSYTASCLVTVAAGENPTVSVTGITLNKSKLSLRAGAAEQLTATITPADATNKNMSWSSENPLVATVDSTGTVTAVAAGTTTITVTSVDGGLAATCTVNVTSVKENNSSGTSSSTALSGQTIHTASGGTVNLAGIKIEVPAGTGLEDFQVTVEKLTDISKLEKQASLEYRSDVYEIKKNKEGSFKKPVIITLPYDQNKVDPSQVLNIYWYDEVSREWIPLDNPQVDQDTVQGAVNHFTKFAVLASLKQVESSDITSFSDITGHWAEKNIQEAVQAGFVDGYPDNTFKPDDNITRAEFISMVVKALHLENQDHKVLFGDINGHWAQASIETAESHGIINGYSDNRFAPDDFITREQMAMIIFRALQLNPSAEPSSYGDLSQISGWAQAAIASLTTQNLLTGYPDGTFKPKGAATRAEAVTILTKALLL